MSQTEFDNHLANLSEGTSVVVSSLQYFNSYFTSLVLDEPWGFADFGHPQPAPQKSNGLYFWNAKLFNNYLKFFLFAEQVNANISNFISFLPTLLSDETESESSPLLFKILLAISKIRYGASALLEKVCLSIFNNF